METIVDFIINLFIWAVIITIAVVIGIASLAIIYHASIWVWNYIGSLFNTL